MAVFSVLIYIKQHPPIQYKNTIYIYSDSLTVLQYLNFSSFPKYNNTKQIIEKILKILIIIQHQHPNLMIQIIKVKSHTNIKGNIIIDNLVRNKTKFATLKQNHSYQTSYQVTLTQIYKLLINKWKSIWKQKANPNKHLTIYHKKYSTKLNTLINKSNLNHHQCGIIMRLLSEHIELNEYLHQKKLNCPINNKVPPSPNCIQCNEPENILHYIMQCKKFETQRHKLFQNLSRINHKFKYNKFRSLKYILFPYKLFNTTTSQQIAIWKEILSYVKNTQRFANLYQIQLNKL